MAGKVLDVTTLVRPDTLASEIGQRWTEWSTFRNTWVEEKKELRNFVFATDTRTTSNNKLPWSNSTTTPKLTQIYDNLKANYYAALFPNSKWMRWEASDKASDTTLKKQVIQAYMDNKIRQSKFELEADRLLDDYILFGNCFATVEHVAEYTTLPDGTNVPRYIGPKVVRISPYDIVFNPIASSFESSPKIVRALITLGELAKMSEGGDSLAREIFSKAMENRRQVGLYDRFEKSDGFIADGFNSIQLYYGSGYVETLTFYGDIYDSETGQIKTNRKIVIVDRAYVMYDEPIANWLGETPIYHAGWRSRPDNLYAMGPLDNLVGLQYRIDHLENLKADVFDQIALPVLKIRGDVEDFQYGPGARVYMGEEGDVAPLVPDATALNADFQIANLQEKMEELAGAPRQAMGIRTPGEKTAFEVQALQNASSRIFQHKAAKFEKEFIEPVLNAMLEAGRRNMDEVDLIRVLDESSGANVFKTITREDITAKGKIVPVGARHYAERATRVQNINQLVGLKMGDPSIGAHLSGKRLAEILAYELGEMDVYGENIAVKEQAEVQGSMQDTEADMLEEMQIKAESGL